MMITRRQLLRDASLSFGALAFSAMLSESQAVSTPTDPLAPKPPHRPARAISVVFLYMDGGVSQVDSFDPKLRLTQENGQPRPFEIDATVFNNNRDLLASPWTFKQYGESGIPVSSLFPHLGTVADELCVIRSMTAFSPSHPNANYALHTGNVRQGHASVGAWVTYGLGTEFDDLPGFVVIHGGQMPSGGKSVFGT